MSSTTSSPCFAFIWACVLYPMALGPIRVARMLKTLISKESGVVKSLEKSAALQMVETALGAPKKREELKAIVKQSPISAFSSLIFGDCRAITEFILETATLHSHCCLYVSPTRVQLCLEEGKVMVQEHTDKEVPLEKVLEIMRIVLKKEGLQLFTSIIHVNTPEAEVIGHRILELAMEMSRGKFQIAQVFIN